MDSGSVKEIFYVVVKGVMPVVNKVLPGAGGWVERGHRAELARLQAEADRVDYNFLQKQIMMETSFSESEGEVASPFSGRNVTQRTLSEELRFSNTDSDASDFSDSISDVSTNSERAVIQRTLAQEMSFSSSDDSQNLSGELVSDEEPVELVSDEEYDGPCGLPCDKCKHFLYTEYVRARSHKALLERIMAEPGQSGFSDLALSHIRDCCLGFYANLDPVDPKWL
jgi:hypothetical protein